jgi:hypothetical protein
MAATLLLAIRGKLNDAILVPGERRCVIFEQYRTVWQLFYFPNIHLPYIPDEFHDTLHDIQVNCSCF